MFYLQQKDKAHIQKRMKKDLKSDTNQALNQNGYMELTIQIDQMKFQVIKLQKSVHQITAFVGSTGTGKSTLASYLRKAPLKSKKGKGGKFIIDHDDTSGKYPKIGHQKQSCTTLPGVYDENGEAYVDLAGWFDTRSPKQQIVNGISNSIIFAPGKQVKVAIVVDSAQLTTQRGGILIQITNRLMQFFQMDFAKIINSCMLVISKCRTDEWDIGTVVDQIHQICEKNQNLKQNTKFLLKTIMQKKRIALFPIPTDIEDHIDIIRDQLSAIRPTILSHNGCVTLSAKAVNMVCNCLAFLNSELNEMGKAFSKDIEIQIQKKSIKDGKTADKIIRQLNVAYNILQSEIKNCLNLEQFERLLNQLTLKLNVSQKITQQMTRNFNMLEFYLKLNKNAKIDKGFLQIIKGKIRQVISKVTAIRDKLVNQQEKKKMQEEHKKEMRQREERNRIEKIRLKREMQQQQEEIKQQLKQQQRRYENQMKSNQESKKRIQDELRKVEQYNKKKIKDQEESYGFGSFLLDVGTLGLWRLFK